MFLLLIAAVGFVLGAIVGGVIVSKVRDREFARTWDALAAHYGQKIARVYAANREVGMGSVECAGGPEVISLAEAARLLPPRAGEIRENASDYSLPAAMVAGPEVRTSFSSLKVVGVDGVERVPGAPDDCYARPFYAGLL